MKTILNLCLPFLLLFFTSIADAKCRIPAKVKYEKEYGWSKTYNVEVTFMTGYELNTATSSYKYSSSSTYAIIFWGEGQATVIKLTSILYCGREVDCRCVQGRVSDMQGHDQDGDKWNICLGSFCY
jgi:hypothetical protein